jgi:Zinc finger C-x8-C-x5-C-x3-H type (and similar)
MPTRTENSDRALANSRRWRLNGSGQLVDTEADVPWEIVEEMNRISLNDSTTDTEVVRLPIRTPPKSKMPGSTVPHINDSSPLDSSSSNSGSSPNVLEHPIPISHSRGSSADNSSARDSVGENPLLAHSPLQVTSAEAKERPHSFSGGLSSADLRRLQQVGDTDHDRQLQQQQWAQSQYREGNVEQLSYPSLANRPLPQQPMFNYPPPTLQTQQRSDSEREDYNHQPQLRRNFNLGPVHGPGMNTAPPPPQYIQGRPNNANQAQINYRQNVRGFPAGPSPTAMVYPGNHHTSHLSLGNTQQLYEMMLPGPPPHDNHNPAVTRVQQQHNIFRATHHHSASDPSAIRDAATLALMQNFTPNMFQPGMPTMPLYPNQYYGQDLVVQQAIAARLQSQYSTPYSVATAQNLPGETGSPTSSSGQTGPSANNRKLGLYKTELCRSWEEKGTCRYGTKCQFAHGEDELRIVSRHPKVGIFLFLEFKLKIENFICVAVQD